ncbi:hypothetical protein NECAME_04829 [Necator americanus]|uniref:Nucleolar protein 16 n=1 Tax=Necator americanus TaxID=51031 RepID=W2SP70_NECAM|nr:hypothetical protein NECAME_04829 [Necator americanus]ETN70671.1 hypothetical protein NECAME_04829 [Necator americanus]
MRSPRSVKRPHTNHHTTNKSLKNVLLFIPIAAPIIKEISEEERVRRAERKKEKKLIAKQNDDEIRRLELERKEKEREERRLKREEEKKRQEELEYQKWQEEQKKKEEQLLKAEAERKAAEKKAAEEKKKEAQSEAKKEKKKEKKQTENEQIFTNTTVKVDKTAPTESNTAPAPKPAEEAEKKKKKKEKEPSIEKEVPVKVVNDPVTETVPHVEVHDEEKHPKKKGGKGKKTNEDDSGHHNGHDEITVTNEVHVDEGHGKPEAHGKKAKKNKKNENESVDVGNGHVVKTNVDETTHVIDSAPVGDVPNGGLVQLDGEKKKGGKGKKHGTAPLESSVVSRTADVVLEKRVTNEIPHGDTNGHEEEHHQQIVEETQVKKIKHKEKKGKQTPEIDVKTEVTVVTEKIKSEENAPNVTTEKVSPPIQVHEVTSTAHENGTKETVHTITTTFETTSSTSPTQFAQNVEKLVSHTLKKAKHDIVEIDPNVKLTIDAQLVKLSEKKPETSTEHKIHITPLPLELHYSRPTTPSNRERVYKLLPRDIIFCSGLIETHGDDYAGMAADPRNIYKENARAIQRKVRIFKESPHYQTYLRAKEEGRTVEEILAEEGQT